MREQITIRGVSYNLCADLGALAEAEYYFCRQGHQVNLAAAIPQLLVSTSNLLEVFACALRAFHPKLGFTAARQLLTPGAVCPVISAISRQWASSEEANEANRHLRFDLSTLGAAAECLLGRERDLRLHDVIQVGFNLNCVRKIFPCALHHWRPELSFAAAQQLMGVDSIAIVVNGLGAAWASASEEEKDRFEAQLLAKNSWTRIAHA